MKKPKNWTGLFLLLVCLLLVPIIGLVVYIDPYIHYHSPRTDRYYYRLEKQRYVNDGLLRHYPYDAVITGSSMTQNFRTTQMDPLFGCQSVKVSSPGGSFHETYGLLEKAFRDHPQLRFVVRSLDMNYCAMDPQGMNYALGSYPTYLYNDCLLDDIYYVLNRDALYDNCADMVLGVMRGFEPGITSLDDYSAFGGTPFGKDAVLLRDGPYSDEVEQLPISPYQREMVLANTRANLTELPAAYPNTQFYYFIPPYSAAWWADCWERGELEVRLELEELLIREILPYENIHLFSWNTLEELTGDLNNYCDQVHYGAWVNDWMLRQMALDAGRLTEENVDDYLSRERARWENFDFNALFEQEDPPEDPIPAFFRQ